MGAPCPGSSRAYWSAEILLIDSFAWSMLTVNEPGGRPGLPEESVLSASPTKIATLSL